ncbi:MAG: SGNH/GDSL hydrolase family protein [Puniceicoccales bacterium]
MKPPPFPIREPIEWLRLWVPDSDQSTLNQPRVLLIGDSIANGYGPYLAEELGDQASIAWACTSRFPADPAFLDELSLPLRYTQFDIIHFNNGLHGFGYSEDDYREHLTTAVDTLRELTPKATWAMATSTPLRDKQNLASYRDTNPRVIVRNEILTHIARERNLPVTDLYSTMEGHPELYNEDATHFTEEGQKLQATSVAHTLKPLL